jgi:hypothetical protein
MDWSFSWVKHGESTTSCIFSARKTGDEQSIMEILYNYFTKHYMTPDDHSAKLGSGSRRWPWQDSQVSLLMGNCQSQAGPKFYLENSVIFFVVSSEVIIDFAMQIMAPTVNVLMTSIMMKERAFNVIK